MGLKERKREIKMERECKKLFLNHQKAPAYMDMETHVLSRGWPRRDESARCLFRKRSLEDPLETKEALSTLGHDSRKSVRRAEITGIGVGM